MKRTRIVSGLLLVALMGIAASALADAVQVIERRYEPYHVEIDARAGGRNKGRLSGAVAAAADDVLLGMYPGRAAAFDAAYYTYANLATADALISFWDSKTFCTVRRPITAIQEGELDGNPATAGDPVWQSLINNPNYPDCTSGANDVTAAMTRTLELFFGTNKLGFEVTGLAPHAVQKARWYFRFPDAAKDMLDGRVFPGIHFRFADVADWTFNHFLLPIEGRDHHGSDPW